MGVWENQEGNSPIAQIGMILHKADNSAFEVSNHWPMLWRDLFMSEEEGTADCSHMILASVGLQSFLFLRRKSRGPELPLPRTHFVARGGTLQRTHTWQRLGSHSQRCCGGRPDPAVGQNRQPFGDVHLARRDGQPPATLKRRAEISSHTKKCVAPPRLRECKVYPSSLRLKKESRRE